MYDYDIGRKVQNNWLNLAKTEEDGVLGSVVGFCHCCELLGCFLPRCFLIRNSCSELCVRCLLPLNPPPLEVKSISVVKEVVE